MHHGKTLVVHTTSDIYSFELMSNESANLLYLEILHWCRRAQFTGELEPNCKGFYDSDNRQIHWITDIGVTEFSGEQILAKESKKNSEALLFRSLFVDHEKPELHHVYRHLSDAQRMKMSILTILDKLSDDEDAAYWLPDLSSDDEFDEEFSELQSSTAKSNFNS